MSNTVNVPRISSPVSLASNNEVQVLSSSPSRIGEGVVSQPGLESHVPASHGLGLTPVKVDQATIDRYTKAGAFDASDLGKFFSGQKAYQNELHDRFPMSAIMESNRSVGLEYEFAHYDRMDQRGEALDSHVKLAESEPFSNLYPRQFELETDSGRVVEIGMPPILVPNKPNGEPDKEKLSEIHQHLHGAMEGIRDEMTSLDAHTNEATIPVLAKKLADKGMGGGWTTDADVREGGRYAKLNVVSEHGGKVNDKVYSQMNISLTGQESAALIRDVRTKFADDPNFAEKGPMGAMYTKLDQLKKPEGVSEDAIVHLNKALANTLAAPSIMMGKELSSQGKKLGEDADLSSAVKELFSVWVKGAPAQTVANAVNPRDLQAFQAQKAKLGEYAEQAGALVKKEGLPGIKAQLDSLELPHAGTNLGGLTAPSFDSRDSYGALEADIDKAVMLDSDKAILRQKARQICDMMDDGGEFVSKGDGSGEFTQAEFNAAFKDFKDEVTRIKTEGPEVGSPVTRQIMDRTEREIDNLVSQIRTGVMTLPEKTTFGSEGFGTGTGVRKDTYVPPSASGVADGEQGLTRQVVEIRSDPAIKQFLSS